MNVREMKHWESAEKMSENGLGRFGRVMGRENSETAREVMETSVEGRRGKGEEADGMSAMLRPPVRAWKMW